MWQKRLIELPKILLGNGVQPPLVSNPIWVLSVLIDVFPVTHLLSLETFLPSHNLFHFWFCRRVVSAVGLGSPMRLHWALLLTCSQKYPGFLAEHLKRVGVFLWLYHWGFILQHVWSQVLFYKEEKNKCFLELSIFLSLRLRYGVIRMLVQLMKARSRCMIGRSNLLRVWSGVRSYHKSVNSELHDRPRNYLLEDETKLLEIFD